MFKSRDMEDLYERVPSSNINYKKIKPGGERKPKQDLKNGKSISEL